MIYAGCTGKIRHGTREQARKAARKFKETRGRRLRVYPCLFCEGWHLTSSAAPRESHRTMYVGSATPSV